MKKLAAVFVTSLFLLTACGGNEVKVNNLSVSDFSSKISDQSVILIDVRTPEEYASGHIEGAKNINLESGYFSQELQKLDKARRYAVYCRSGHRSAIATQEMAKTGFKFLYNLNGGVINWINSGKSLVTK